MAHALPVNTDEGTARRHRDIRKTFVNVVIARNSQFDHFFSLIKIDCGGMGNKNGTHAEKRGEKMIDDTFFPLLGWSHHSWMDDVDA